MSDNPHEQLIRDWQATLDDDPIMQFFGFQHLPIHLQPISAKFAQLAVDMVKWLPRNPERTVALRKLLEAKDCAVRAYIYVDTRQ